MTSNKGFTLIELIAIIIVIAAICFVTFPNLISVLKNSDTTEFNTYKENLCAAGKSYINANKSNYSNLNVEGTKITISVRELQNFGIVDISLKDPEDKTEAKDHSLIFKVLSDKSLECSYK